MMFWFKKKKVVIDCFTYDDAAFNLYPIRKAMPYYPDTLKQMPMAASTVDTSTNIQFTMPTMKACTGITGLYKHGAILPFWTDYVCQPKRAIFEKKSKLGLADGHAQRGLVEHQRIQFPGMFEDYVNVKFSGVWQIKEPTGLDVLLIPTTYNLNNYNYNFLIPPAMSYYDLQTQLNLQMFVRADSPDFTLYAGTPMVHLIPITEREVEWKKHLVTHEEWIKIQGKIPLSFPQLGGSKHIRYNKLVRQQQEMDAMEAPKCPFGFGRK